MARQQIDYDGIIKEYSTKDPRVANAIRLLQSQYQEELSKSKRKKKILDIYTHDVRGPSSTLEALSNVKKFLSSPLEKQAEKIEMIHSIARIYNYRLRLLGLSNGSKEELMRKSQTINLADMAETYAKGIELHLKKHKITLNIKSNEYQGEPISIYGHTGATGSMFENIYGGMLDFAPEQSKGKIAINRNETSLEIMAENKYIAQNRIRRVAGDAKGLGLPSMEDFVKMMGGTLELYDDTRIKRSNIFYDNCRTLGYRGKLEDHPKAKTFGIRITLPTDNLRAK